MIQSYRLDLRPMERIFEPPNKKSWQQAQKRLKLPLHERIGIMPPCKCVGHLEEQQIGLAEALNSVQSFADLCPIIRNANTCLGYLGDRYVTVEGYSGNVPIDALAERVRELVKKNPDFDQAERSHGRTIATLINNLYKVSDKQVENSSLITKIIIFFRSLPERWENFGTPITCSHIRWYWVECETLEDEIIVAKATYKNRGYNKIFTKYTQKQFESVIYQRYDRIMYPDPEYLFSALEGKPLSREEIFAKAAGSSHDSYDALTSAAAQGFEDVLEILLTSTLSKPSHTELTQNTIPYTSTIYYGEWDHAVGQALILTTYHKHLSCVDLLLKHKKSINPEAVVRAISMAEFNGDIVTMEKLKKYLITSEPSNKLPLGNPPKYSQPFRNQLYR